MKRVLFAAAIFSGVCVGSAQAQDVLPDDNGLWTYHQSPRWRESESHPLRVVAYVVHPIGWVLREGIFRPWSYVAGSTRFTRSFFGFREPADYRQPLCYHGSEEVPDCHSLAPYASTPVEEEEEVEAVEEQKVVFPDVAFEFDKSSLNALGKARVRQVSQMLSSMPSVNVVVEGHADIVGTDEYNQKLGMRRAEAVVKELSDLGVDKARMSPVSHGEGRPIFTEDADWARAANRRVQFSVQGATPVTPEPAAAAEATDAMPEAKS
ncbi:MAG: OmpA family protein [Deltaproteobacteria bacterium]|nr:OmpA family protein [Deltaproteobacteria bacterium]